MRLKLVVNGFRTDCDTARVRSLESIVDPGQLLTIHVEEKVQFTVTGDLETKVLDENNLVVEGTRKGNGTVQIKSDSETYTLAVKIGAPAVFVF